MRGWLWLACVACSQTQPYTEEDAGDPMTGYLGTVSITQDVTYALVATFSIRPIVYGCSTSIGSSCIVRECPVGPIDGTKTPAFLSAGELTISGGNGDVVLMPGSSNTYAITGKTALYKGGETLVASAQGLDVPAFSVSITAPSTVTVDTPVLTGPNTQLMIPRDAPYQLAWKGTNGNVVTTLATSDATRAVTITCTYAAAGGTGVVTVDALAKLPNAKGVFSMLVTSESTRVMGEWTIHFQATNIAKTPSGDAVVGQIVP